MVEATYDNDNLPQAVVVAWAASLNSPSPHVMHTDLASPTGNECCRGKVWSTIFYRTLRQAAPLLHMMCLLPAPNTVDNHFGLMQYNPVGKTKVAHLLSGPNA